MIGYQGSYPHLRIAREHGLPFPMILMLDEWFDTEPFPADRKAAGPRFREMFNTLDFLCDEEVQTIMEKVSIARKHFQQQQEGCRDMNGVPCVGEIGAAGIRADKILRLDDFRRLRR